MAINKLTIDPTAFKLISDEKERDLIFRAITQVQADMQLKPQVTAQDKGEMTNIKAEKSIGPGKITALHISGPPLQPMEISMVFEVSNSLFFSIGKIVSFEANVYTLDLKDLFSLQRRSSFRIPLPSDLVDAVFKVTVIDGKPSSTDVSLNDISEGGIGFGLTKEQAIMLKPGALFGGVLCVNKVQPVSLTLQVRYVRESIANKLPYHAGGMYTSVNAQVQRKISAVVNECHKVVFTRSTGAPRK
jgi:hypothetical protein